MRKCEAASWLITVILILLVVWSLFLSFWGRRLLIKILRFRITRLYDSNNSIDIETLDDLIYLGEQGKRGNEKKSVLDELKKLAEYVIQSDGYDGSVLDNVIKGVEKIVANGKEPGCRDDFERATEILISIKNHLNVQSKKNQFALQIPMNQGEGLVLTDAHDYRIFHKVLSSVQKKTKLKVVELADKNDYRIVIDVLRDICLSAVKHEFTSTGKDCVEAIVPKSTALFQIGKFAFLEGHHFVSLVSLNKLDDIAQRQLKFKANEDVFNLLGLIAYFWAGGESSRKQAEDYLRDVKDMFDPSFMVCTEAAIEYHRTFPHYDTADKLLILLREYPF